MLKIQKSSNGQVVFTLSGRMDEEDISELERLIRSETNGRPVILDLRNLVLVGQDAISFLARCEADRITLKNCARYVREWISRSEAKISDLAGRDGERHATEVHGPGDLASCPSKEGSSAITIQRVGGTSIEGCRKRQTNQE